MRVFAASPTLVKVNPLYSWKWFPPEPEGGFADPRFQTTCRRTLGKTSIFSEHFKCEVLNCNKVVSRLKTKMKCLWTLLLILSLSKAQNLGCECQSGTPCQRTDFDIECIRTPRPDCPCCLVCPQQEGQSCDENSQPCDLSKGLFCNTTISVCQKGKKIRGFLNRKNRSKCQWNFERKLFNSWVGEFLM